MGFKQYVKENWGMPFVAGFIVFLCASAIPSVLGLPDLADILATYAFCSLLLGVGLQVGSYLKSDGNPEEKLPSQASPYMPKSPMGMRRKAETLIVATMLVAGSASAVGYYYFYYFPKVSPFPTHTFLRLNAAVSFCTTLRESDGSVIVAFGVTAIGGEMPYSFVAHWGDNFTQSSSSPVFTRTFSGSELVPASAMVQVTSSDNQTTDVSITITSSFHTTNTIS